MRERKEYEGVVNRRKRIWKWVLKSCWADGGEGSIWKCLRLSMCVMKGMGERRQSPFSWFSNK
jgi:hypothetical protein